ncbi:MAG TPA: hypothetical protein VMM60_08950 [Ilumatobacter sp.]|nr:hypothetical protein [Ilumatobacter sp.]
MQSGGLVEAGASLTIPTMILTPRAPRTAPPTDFDTMAEQHAS